eukprot:3005470-Amphidinium_carterae.1
MPKSAAGSAASVALRSHSPSCILQRPNPHKRQSSNCRCGGAPGNPKSGPNNLEERKAVSIDKEQNSAQQQTKSSDTITSIDRKGVEARITSLS